MTNHIILKHTRKSLLAMTALCAGSVFVASPAALAADDGPRVLDEIIVMAQKRQQSLQEVPIAATALTGDALAVRFAKDFTDISGAVPNVSFELEGLSNYSASFYIRGQGVLNRGPFVDPAVAVVTDGITAGRVATSMTDFLDIEAIEILRGPQGTLQGRNATAGAILVRHFKPNVDELEGNVGVTVGNYGRLDVKNMINVPLVEGVAAFRIASKYTKTNGFYTNIYDGQNESIGGQNRFTLLPSVRVMKDDWELTVRGNYSRYRDDASVLVPLNHCGEDPRINPGSLLNDSFARVVATSADPNAGPDAAYNTCAKNPTKDRFTVNQDRDLPNQAELDIWGVSTELNYDIDGSGTVTYVANYQESEELSALDVDAGPVQIFWNAENTKHWQMSQEVRFASDFSETVDFVVGAMWMKQEYNLKRIDGFNRDTRSGQKNEQLAAFIHADWHLTDALTVVTAGRYTSDKKDFSICSASAVSCDGRTQFGSEKWTDFSPRVGVNYKVDENTFVYAYAARGFRAGGFNGEAANINAAGPFEPEKNTTYEVGFKVDALDDRLRLNGAFFYMDVDNLQRSISRVTNGVVELVTQNAAAARFKGAELDMVFLATDELTINATVGWLDAKYKTFCQDLNGAGANDPSLVPCAPAVGAAQPVDLTHLPLARAPKWTYRINAVYEVEMAGGMTAFSLELVHNSSLMTLDQGAPIMLTTGLDNFDGTRVSPIRQATNVLNGSITWRDDAGKYKVALYGKNLTDEIYYRRLSLASPTLSFGTLNTPREFGVELTYNF